MPSPPESLDPRFATSAVAMRLAQLVAAPLVLIGDDLTPRPFLAERITAVSPTVCDVRLRPHLRFHDGSPVTAHDVAWTFASLKDPATGSPHRGRLQHLVTVDALDDQTARFTFDAPWPAFWVDANAYGILSRRACTTGDCRRIPIGAGPFRVLHDGHDDERWLLGAWDGSPVPRPGVDEVRVSVARDNGTRLLALLDGSLDLVVSDLPPADLTVAGADPGLAVESVPGIGFSYLAFNLRGPRAGLPAGDDEESRTLRALADARVRRALGLALDLDAVIAAKLQGRARRAAGLLPPGHWAAASDARPLAFDPDAAERLLDEAGYPRNAAGHRFRLVLSTTTDRLRKSTALVFADAWRRVGVDVTVQVKEWAALYEDIQAGAFHAFSAKWLPVIEPDLLHWVFHSNNVPTRAAAGGPGKAGGNRGAYVDLELDAWLDEAQRTDDRATRAALYERAARRLAEQLPVLPLWFEDEVAVRNRRLTGFTLERTGSLLPLAAARLE